MATITENPQRLDLQPDGDKGHVRLLTLAVVVLGIAVVGLGAWALFGDSQQTEKSPTAVSAEVEQLLNEYTAAWNEADGDAFLSLISDDFIIESGRYGSFTGPQQAGYLGLVAGWHSDVLGESIMVGEGPLYVSASSRITADEYPPEGVYSISTFKIVEEDGTLKIARHFPYGELFDE